MGKGKWGKEREKGGLGKSPGLCWLECHVIKDWPNGILAKYVTRRLDFLQVAGFRVLTLSPNNFLSPHSPSYPPILPFPTSPIHITFSQRFKSPPGTLVHITHTENENPSKLGKRFCEWLLIFGKVFRGKRIQTKLFFFFYDSCQTGKGAQTAPKTQSYGTVSYSTPPPK